MSINPNGITHAQRFERRREIAQHVKDGNSTSSACQQFEVSLSTVLKACREFNVPVFSTNGKHPTSCYMILADLLNTDDTLRAIALRYGISPQRVGNVYTLARQVGIKVPARKLGRKEYSDAKDM